MSESCPTVDRCLPSVPSDSSAHTSLGLSKLGMSRKRLAATRLPRISVGFGHWPNGEDDITKDASTTLEPMNKFSKQASSSQPSSSGESSSKSLRCDIDLTQPKQLYLNINNTVVNGYKLVGAGKEVCAFHIETKIVRTCQLIDVKNLRTLYSVKSRLKEARRYWGFDDLEEMSEFVLSDDVEIYNDYDGKRIFMFSPMHYGSLQSKIHCGCCALSESQIKPIIKLIARVLAFCHSIGIVVRDLRPRKFVFVDENKSQMRFKDVFDTYICDNIEDDSICDRHCCPAYVAPEILVKSNVKYSGRAADMWALGVLLYFLLFRNYPYYADSLQQVFKKILSDRLEVPRRANLSSSTRVLLYGLLRKNPSNRLKARDLLRIPWILVGSDEVLGVTRFRFADPEFLERFSKRPLSEHNAARFHFDTERFHSA